MTKEKAISVLEMFEFKQCDLGRMKHTQYTENDVWEAMLMAIEALKGDMYCPNCGVRLVPEDEYLEPTQTHGRLIDADALMEYCSNQKTKTIDNNDIARFPTADAVSREEYDKMKEIAKSWQDEFRNANEIVNKLSANRPHGEWISNHDGSWNCSECGLRVFIYAKGNYCPNCGCDMRGDDN